MYFLLRFRQVFAHRTPHTDLLPPLRRATWAPLHFRFGWARPVSCYAFFKGWLLPSPPPGCYRLTNSFTTELLLGGLSVWSGLFPSWLWTLAPKVCLQGVVTITGKVFGVSLRSVRLWAPISHRVLYPLSLISLRSTSIDFVENQLSPGSIGFSPLTRSHPRLLPQTWVQPSRMYYHPFSLLLVRSPGFGSNLFNSIFTNSWFKYAFFKLAFALPPPKGLSMLNRFTRWPIMQKVRRSRESPVGCAKYTPQNIFSGSTACKLWVSGLFHSHSWVLFTFPSRYLFTIGQSKCFRVRGWPPFLQTIQKNRFTL